MRGPSDFERVFAAMAASRPDALLFVGDQLTLQHGQEIVSFVTQKRIPSMFDRPHLVTRGGLMSYGADEEDSNRQTAIIADKIFKGAKPADLPMEQPTRFHLRSCCALIRSSSKARLDPRVQVLRAAAGFARCSMPSYDRALWTERIPRA